MHDIDLGFHPSASFTMSVAMSGAGGAGYMPMQTAMPQMRTPNFNNTSSNQSVNLRMPTFAGPTESKKDLRGDLSGDECLTLDVDEVVLSAIWIESTCECVVAVAKLPPEESRDPLSDSNLDLISLFVTETTRKLQQQSAAALLAKESADAAKKTQAAKNKKKKKDNSLASGKGGITLVLPSSISQDSLRSAVAKVTLSGFTTKNVFGRGIATITGVLSRSAGMGDSNHSNDLLSVLDSGKKSGKLLDQDPVVLHIYFRNKGSNVSLDSALVVLERGNGVRNNLGYERLCTIAVDDRVCDSSKKGVETALRDALDNLMSIAKMEEVSILFHLSVVSKLLEKFDYVIRFYYRHSSSLMSTTEFLSHLFVCRLLTYT